MNIEITAIKELASRVLSSLDNQLLQAEINEIASRVSLISGSISKRLHQILIENMKFRQSLVDAYRLMDIELGSIQGEKERIERMMRFLKTFSPKSRLSGDKAAFKRWMDSPAVRERARIALHRSEKITEITISILSESICTGLSEQYDSGSAKTGFCDGELISQLWIEFDESPRWQNRLAVLKTFSRIAGLKSSTNNPLELTSQWNATIDKSATDVSEHPAIRLECLRIRALLCPDKSKASIFTSLWRPKQASTDIFLHAGLIKLIADLYTLKDLQELIDEVFARPHPSEYTQIRAAEMVARFEPGQALETGMKIFNNTPEKLTAKAAGVAVFSLCQCTLSEFKSNGMSKIFLLLTDVIASRLKASPGQQLVRRAALESLRRIMLEYCRTQTDESITEFEHKILSIIGEIISSTDNSEILKRSASVIREEILLTRNPNTRCLLDKIRKESEYLGEGESFILKRSECKDLHLLGRVLALIAADDFGFSVIPGRIDMTIIKGDIYKRKIWRIINEFTNPDASKRQGFLHTVGRESVGTIRAPSRLLCETTETKVPGERLLDSDESTWRPYVPTVDDILSLCTGQLAGLPIAIYSSEGITEIKGPKNKLDRLMLWIRLTIDYADLAKRRNLNAVHLDELVTRSFIQVLIEDYNIAVHFKPFSYMYNQKNYSVIDPTVARNLSPVTEGVFRWS